jgi:hypothetical protein
MKRRGNPSNSASTCSPWGSTIAAFRNSGTLGEGWLARHGIDAAVHELNVNWIAGLKDYPCAAHWQRYGGQLARVFYEFFDAVKP